MKRRAVSLRQLSFLYAMVDVLLRCAMTTLLCLLLLFLLFFCLVLFERIKMLCIREDKNCRPSTRIISDICGRRITALVSYGPLPCTLCRSVAVSESMSHRRPVTPDGQRVDGRVNSCWHVGTHSERSDGRCRHLMSSHMITTPNHCARRRRGRFDVAGHPPSHTAAHFMTVVCHDD